MTIPEHDITSSSTFIPTDMHGLVHHIELYVSDLPTSTAFWSWLLTEKFSYSVYQQWDQGISFRLHDTYIVLVQTEERYLDIPYHRKRTGLNHLAFHCVSRESVDAIAGELHDKGITSLYLDTHRNTEDYHAIYFEDPDRIKIELVAHPNRSKEHSHDG